MRTVILAGLAAMIAISGLWAVASAQETIRDVIEPKILSEMEDQSNNVPGQATILVYSNTSWTGITSGDDLGMSSKDGSGDAKFAVSCEAGFATLAQGNFQKSTERGYLAVAIIQYGKLLKLESTTADFGLAWASAECIPQPKPTPAPEPESAQTEGGGCLIATATYGTELAPQVQTLRGIRDGQLMQTESGQAFLAGFNSIYYSFSPAVADYERENPAFRELVKLTLTPMIHSLSLLEHADIDTEAAALLYGAILILLNAGMYIAAPAAAIIGLTKRRAHGGHHE